MHNAGPGIRLVVVANQLQVNRVSLRQSVDALMDQQLVRKNPGYGHPLRPEYILTAAGQRAAEACSKYVSTVGSSKVCYRKWSSLVLLTIHLGNQHFNDIRTDLEITPRALTLALRSLEEERLVKRVVEDGYPPRTSYRLFARAEKIARQTKAIAGCLT